MSTYWSDAATARAGERRPVIVNDSKTPSGRAHVGALRGVLIHDALFRSARALDAGARYTFGSDDYDALDALPFGLEDLYRPHLGRPLCDVPAPPGSDRSDIADHFISEFFELFALLGVDAETYRMRDVYRSGEFDHAIDLALRHADVIRAAYLEASGSDKGADWYPVQVVCPRCGKLGSTIVTGYDGEQVTFECRPDLVDWAEGCGLRGKVSPFGGGGKLPWKVEWAAKWAFRGVTIEGAGKDHSTRGGSRDVTRLVAERAFGASEPLNVPYEFFLVGGAKMSSSAGRGASAAGVVDVLGPSMVRFLVLRLEPNRAINFTPDRGSINSLVHDWQRLCRRVDQGDAPAADRRLRELVDVGPAQAGALAAAPVDFDTTASLVAMPHLDRDGVHRSLAGAEPTPGEEAGVGELVRMSLAWLDAFGTAEDRLDVRDDASAEWPLLSHAQREFTARLHDELSHGHAAAGGAELQTLMYEIARLVPLPAGSGFEAVYRCVLDRRSGPRAGSLLAAIGPERARALLPADPPGTADLWRATGLDEEAWRRTVEDRLARGDTIESLTGRWHEGHGVVDARAVDRNGRPSILRWFVTGAASPAAFEDDVTGRLAAAGLVDRSLKGLQFELPDA